MSQEQPQFRPGVEEDAEYYLVTVRLKTGEKVTECLPKNFSEIILDKEGAKVSRADAIEAVQRFYPEMEKPNLREAVRKLREERRKRHSKK